MRLDNRLWPPLTDPNYGLAQAVEWWVSRYENVIAQPILLGSEATQRFLGATPPLPRPPQERPLPWETNG